MVGAATRLVEKVAMAAIRVLEIPTCSIRLSFMLEVMRVTPRDCIGGERTHQFDKILQEFCFGSVTEFRGLQAVSRSCKLTSKVSDKCSVESRILQLF